MNNVTFKDYPEVKYSEIKPEKSDDLFENDLTLKEEVEDDVVAFYPFKDELIEDEIDLNSNYFTFITTPGLRDDVKCSNSSKLEFLTDLLAFSDVDMNHNSLKEPHESMKNKCLQTSTNSYVKKLSSSVNFLSPIKENPENDQPLVNVTFEFVKSEKNKVLKTENSVEDGSNLQERNFLFNCVYCAEIFESDRSLSVHVASKHLSNQRFFECDYCARKFLKKRCVRYHILKIHKALFSSCNQWQQLKHKCKTCFPEEKQEKCNFYNTSDGKSASDNLKQRKSLLTSNKTHICQVCKKLFQNKMALLRHIDCHYETAPFECILCGTKFKRAQALHRHLITHYKNEKRFNCRLCEKKFNFNYHLQKHLLTHYFGLNIDTSSGFSCSICKKVCKKRSSLLEHMESHIKSRPYKCHLCPAEFRNRSSLRVHKIFKHETESHFKCSLCPKEFKLNKHLTRHMKIHAPVKTTGNSEYFCRICNRYFSSKSKLNGHLKCHDKTKQQCLICAEKLNTLHDLRAHTYSKHKNEKHFICEICSKGYNRKDCFQQHVASHDKKKSDASKNKFHHSSEVPFKNKSGLLENLKNPPHEFISDLAVEESLNFEKNRSRHQYSSPSCPEKFKTVKSFKKQQPNERPYKCDFCSKTYKRSSHCKDHMRIHFPAKRYFVCVKCGTSFATKASYSLHIKGHSCLTNRKSFPCSVCEKKISFRLQLELHMECHADECITLLECAHCNKKWISKSDLIIHLKREHSESLGNECIHTF